MESYRQFKKISTVLILLSIGWMAISAGFFPATAAGRQPAPAVGFPAPGFVLQAINGDDISYDGRQGKPVVINFWASWCLPCQAEMPALEKVYQEYSPQGLMVYGINATSQDSLAEVESFIHQSNITFPILLDQSGTASRLFALRALPTTYFISSDGVIQHVWVGGPLSEAYLSSQVISLMGEEK